MCFMGRVGMGMEVRTVIRRSRRRRRWRAWKWVEVNRMGG